MSDLSEIPWRRDPAEVEPLLDTWAKHRVGPGAAVRDVVPPGGNGMSSETVLFSLDTGDGRRAHHAARLAPLPSLYPVFPHYDLASQARCMELVGATTDVPVPTVRWLEDDPVWLGVPFLVMDRIDGAAPSDMPPYVFDGPLVRASPEERAALEANSVSILVRLHRLTPATHDLAFLDRPEHGATPLDQHLGAQRWYYDWAREDRRYPIIERTFAWLDANRPAEGSAVLNWGDARIGNMLYQGSEPVGVLDWEMAAVGPPEIDVAWMIFMHHFFQDLAERFGVPGLPGFMARDNVARAYTEGSGRPVESLEWYEVFAAIRFAIVSVRTSTRAIAYDTMEEPADPDDLVMFRSMLEDMLSGAYWS